MSEHLTIPKGLSRAEKYQLLLPQLEALLAGETDIIANLANTAAVLRSTFEFFWVGFYFVKGDELVLGPFQGPVACTRFPITKGVCGASVEKKATIIVPDVDKFPGHIACSSESRSEIVVPLVENGEVILILDIDSDRLNDFDKTDQAGLEKVISTVRKVSNF